LFSVAITIIFQSVFYFKIYQNNIFLFLKIYFNIIISKNNLKILKTINLKKINFV